MKIQYELGDKVKARHGNRNVLLEVVGVRSQGVAVDDRHGETVFLGKNQVLPLAETVESATFVGSPVSLSRDSLLALADGLRKGMTLADVKAWVDGELKVRDSRHRV